MKDFPTPWTVSSGVRSPSDAWAAIHAENRSLVLYESVNEDELPTLQSLFVRIAHAVNEYEGRDDHAAYIEHLRRT